MLLCIEMFFFSLLHIVAFPWRIYDISKNPDPAVYYRGGFGGWRALAEAFNPWDIIKASARGFRWLFVGRRHRTDDASYQESTKMKNLEVGRTSRFGSSSGSTIPLPATFDGAGDGRDGRPEFRRQDSDNIEDHAGLLSNAQGVPTINVRSPSPFRDASPDSRFQKEESPYEAESGYHAVPYPRESMHGGPQYGEATARFPDAYEGRVYTPPSPVDTPPGERPAARLPDEETDLGYHGAGGVQGGKWL